MKISVELLFTKPGYIADPYWPELEKYINIQKQSGLNRARSEANRRKALQSWLEKNEMTLEQYEDLGRRAKRPFYRANGSDDSEIVIPVHQMYGCLVAMCDTARSSIQPVKPEQCRTAIRLSDPFKTGKATADGVFERFVTVTAGTGQKLSNQRALRSNPYICDFVAKGVMEIDTSFVDPDTLKAGLEFAGREVGIGACRKLAWGRFTLAKFEMQG